MSKNVKWIKQFLEELRAKAIFVCWKLKNVSTVFLVITQNKSQKKKIYKNIPFVQNDLLFGDTLVEVIHLIPLSLPSC